MEHLLCGCTVINDKDVNHEFIYHKINGGKYVGKTKIEEKLKKEFVLYVIDFSVTKDGKIIKEPIIYRTKNKEYKSDIIELNTNHPKFLFNLTFKNAKNLKNITIKGNVKYVGENAFQGINKKAVFKIKATKANYKKIVSRIKKSGAPKTVTYKRIK